MQRATIKYMLVTIIATLNAIQALVGDKTLAFWLMDKEVTD